MILSKCIIHRETKKLNNCDDKEYHIKLLKNKLRKNEDYIFYHIIGDNFFSCLCG